MTARILLSGLIRRPIRSAPCSGTLIRYSEEVWRGQIIGRCGCVTRFEAARCESEFGLFYRLFELSDAARQGQRVDLTRVQWVNSHDARRGGACGNANALEYATKRRPDKERRTHSDSGDLRGTHYLTWRAGSQLRKIGVWLCASFFRFRRGFLKRES